MDTQAAGNAVAPAAGLSANTKRESSGPSSTAWGLLRVGTALLALRVQALQEVIACPPRLDTLPASAPGLCGAVRLRGQVLPVLCLRTVLGLLGTAAGGAVPGAVIVLMRHEGRLLGLRADAVQGMAQVQPAQMQALQHGDAAPAGTPAGGVSSGQVADIATHAFEIGEQVATVLDPARIAALPGVPMVDTRPTSGTAQAASQGEAVLLFRCAGTPLAIAAAAVDATVPETDLQDSPLRRGACVGVFLHHGQELAALDLGALLGLPAPVQAPADGPVAGALPRSALLVLRTARGLVGLGMDSVSDIVRVAPADVLPVPALGLAQPALYRGLVAPPAVSAGPGVADTPPHLLLNEQTLGAHELLLALGSLGRVVQAVGAKTVTPAHTVAGENHRAAGQAAHAFRPGSQTSPHRTLLTYQAGVETASPLVQVTEIISLPGTLVRTAPPGARTLGVFTHRGASLPLVDLAAVLGRHPQTPAAHPADRRVLIVDDGERRIGFSVDGLGTIETAAWEGPEAAGAGAEFNATQFAARPPLVELGQGAQRRTLARLDLQQLSRSLHAS